MSTDRLAWFAESHRAVIGMIHLPPLAGSPRFGGNWSHIEARVTADTKALIKGGVNGLMLENFADTPFYPNRVPAETVVQMTALAMLVKRITKLPMGINVLRNDGQTALAIAQAVGAEFIRVNILCGARVTDQGLIQGIAHELLRDRKRLAADQVAILADVDVKHSVPLARQSIEQEVEDLIERAGADALIVTGSRTGRATSAVDVQQVHAVAGTTPVLVGSGASEENLEKFLPAAAGFIVGTAFKQNGRPENAVEASRVRAFMDCLAERTQD